LKKNEAAIHREVIRNTGGRIA